MIVGVLALQGDFAEHIDMLQSLDVQTREVRLAADLDGLDGLIIPGGESTTIGKLAVDFDLFEPLRQFGQSKPVWGTCAGAIFLSKDATRAKNGQPLLGLLAITIERNAFGRQVDSFEVSLDVPALVAVDPTNAPYHGIFIRAPLIESVNSDDVEIIATLADGRIVAVRQGDLLATSFHPELNTDTRFHEYFLSFLQG